VWYCDVVAGMLMVHVTTQPADREELIATRLQKAIMIPTEKPEHLSDEQWDHANDLIRQLQPLLDVKDVVVMASIVLFARVLTTEMLQSVREMYKSGQLTVLVRDLFRCLAMDESLAVEVEITAEEFKQCEDGLARKGKSILLFCVACVRFNETYILIVTLSHIVSVSTIAGKVAHTVYDVFH